MESMKIILGGSMARVGALSECPFQGDESIHNAGNRSHPLTSFAVNTLSLSFSLTFPEAFDPPAPNLLSLTSCIGGVDENNKIV